MAKAPAFQFYVKDWLSDAQLKMASHSTKGIWADMLCFMWDTPVRGEFTGSVEQMKRALGANDLDFQRFINESKSLLFCDISVTDNEIITVRNRRMWRDEKDRKNNRDRQARHRNKHNNNKKITPPSSSPSPPPKKKKEKKILSDEDWIKTLEDNPIYEGIEVRVLHGKMLVWCTNNGKKPTRRRFVNWLNREDKPMKQGTEKPETPKGKPTLRCQKCEKQFFHLIRIREMNLCSDCAEKV
jgi:hypothetical protein